MQFFLMGGLKPPPTGILLFLNPQLFLSRFKSSPVRRLSDLLQFDYFPLWRAALKIIAGCMWAEVVRQHDSFLIAPKN